jgi:hypothetical protein
VREHRHEEFLKLICFFVVVTDHVDHVSYSSHIVYPRLLVEHSLSLLSARNIHSREKKATHFTDHA